MADPETLVPRMKGALEEERLRALPLAAVDRFVLSLVDGETTVRVLAETVGLATEDVLASLLKLEALGIVALPTSSMRPPPPGAAAARAPFPPRPPPLPHGYSQKPPPVASSQPSPARAGSAARTSSPSVIPPPPASSPRGVAGAAAASSSGPARTPPAIPAPPTSAPRMPPPMPSAPARPVHSPPAPQAATAEQAATAVAGGGGGGGGDTEIDLEPDHQREIDATFARLETMDHYAILGLDRSADRKAIKRAYFGLTARFHPDRFFRKRLGPFKLKMETVFGRMTEAHDTLTASDRRAEYDAYLGSVERTRSIEQLISEAESEIRRAEEATLGDVSSGPPPPPSSPALPPESSSKPLGPSGGTSPRVTSPNLGAFIADALDGRPPSKAPPNPNPVRISIPPTQNEPPGARARRELLARRLTGASPRVPTAPKVPSIGYVKTEDAVGALKRRYEEKVSAARTSQARKYTEAGYAARAKGDMVAAANSLRVALTFDTENAELKVAHEEAQRAADQLLVEQYLKQAEYEERSERWGDAGRSWGRVARTQTANAKAHERAAFCLMKADGDLHEAVALGQRSVQLEPKNAGFRRTMANVYLAAGLSLNAKRELEAVLQLAPDDPATQTLLKRIQKSS